MPPPSQSTNPRGSAVPRPTSLHSGMPRSSTAESTNTNASTAPTNTISRPSLLAGLSLPTPGGRVDSLDGTIAPPRPRRLWTVNDTSLKPVPFFYPPLDPRCSTFVSDAPPSVVAVRIAECLRKRSVSVEYDEEAVTATCMTVDRCHFIINLFQGSSSNRLPRNANDLETKPDFSHGVIVECMRLRGNCISFHHCCRAVLNAALSHSTGEDTRKPHQTACNEFPRMSLKRSMNLLSPRSSKKIKPAPHSSTALEALERAYQLLRKDRLGPQQLAMESLVMLTDPESSGIDTALHCSLAVLGAPITGGCGDEGFLSELHDRWIYRLLQDRVLPGEEDSDGPSSTCTRHRNDVTSAADWGACDEHHGGVLRSLCLRAFSNALALVAQEQPSLLSSILNVQSRHLVSRPFIGALLEDLAGAIRPPSVVQGTRLASAHEAALAIRCLGILGEYSDVVKSQMMTDSVLSSLEKARYTGRSTHEVLAQEAERTYSRLTEDVRSC